MDFKKAAIGIVIFILTVTFIYYANALINERIRNEYKEVQVYSPAKPEVLTSCEKYNPSTYRGGYGGPNEVSTPDASKYEECSTSEAYLEAKSQYQQDWDEYDKVVKENSDKRKASEDSYKKRSFITILVMSIIAIIAGVLVMKVGAVSFGLIGAGLVTLAYVMIRYFYDIDKPVKTIIVGLALVILIWLAYAKLPDEKTQQ